MASIIPINNSNKKSPFLKWAGGKMNLLPVLLENFPEGDVLVEPFVGSGAVFLNTFYKKYILADSNKDLINTFQLAQKYPEKLIEELKLVWKEEHKNKECYLEIRKEFNEKPFEKSLRRSALFIFMNRFGYHGLCRYNSKGGFNVPYGPTQTTDVFPDDKIMYFAERAQNAEFYCQDFKRTFELVPEDAVVYCDPPYVPLKPNSFTKYSINEFSINDHYDLASEIKKCVNNHVHVKILISNHDTEKTRELYEGALIKQVQARRQIAHNKENRNYVSEIIASFIK